MDPRILIVDDHPTVQESLRFVFAAAGMRRVMEATTSNEALETMRKSRVDVVLLDVVLREDVGFDALRKIKAFDPAAAVLVHTYHDTPRLLSRSFHAGAAGYVVKGRDKNALIHAVRQTATGGILWTAAQMDQIRQVDADSKAMVPARSAAVRVDAIQAS